MPVEEPHDGAEARLAEDEEGSAGEEGGQGKRDERSRNDRLRVVFPDYFGDFACGNVEERLPDTRWSFSARTAGRGVLVGGVVLEKGYR